MPASEVFAPDLLAGEVALVTVGGTGLGKAAAAELVASGARVLVTGRRAEVLAAAASEIGCEWATGDVRSPDDAARLVDTALDRFGRLDVLVNNAGGQYFAPAEAIEAKGWRAVLALNVGGILEMSSAAFDRAFRAAGSGHDRQRHALSPPRPDRHGPLERGARGRRGPHARARRPLGGRGRHGRSGRRRPLQHRRAAKVPRGGPRGRRPHRAASAPRPPRRNTPGWTRCWPHHSAKPSAARP
jgi:NAD(P)-dependent dehydrogenase (short-subunit alcohol dehydrogenase family)